MPEFTLDTIIPRMWHDHGEKVTSNVSSVGVSSIESVVRSSAGGRADTRLSNPTTAERGAVSKHRSSDRATLRRRQARAHRQHMQGTVKVQ